MNILNLLIVSFLTTSLSPWPTDIHLVTCDITVDTRVKESNRGKSDGEIVFIVAENTDTKRYKIFLLNKGSDVAKKELKDMKISGLSEGFYDFIIIDTKGDKCYKELTIVLKGS